MVSVMLHRYVSRPEPVLAKKWRRGNFDSRPTTFEMYVLEPTSHRDFWLGNEWTTFTRERPNTAGASRIEIQATADEFARWSQAQASAQDALRAAEVRLVHHLGLRIVGGDRPSLRRGYGWRAARRRFDRSGLRRAFDEFREQLHDIDGEYRPVRELIATRIQQAEVQAQEQAAQRWAALKRKAERDKQFHALAEQTRWRYEVDEADQVVHVFRANDSTMTIATLTQILRKTYGGYTVRWNDHDRVESEQANGIDFETWWRAVTPGSWVDSRKIPDPPRPTPSIGGHTSYGVGGHTSFGGHLGI
ncbi:hypothetical protein [Nocardia vaccinii]|uniref:hypothetical protein n=1 Tax=Nocardia vaccinii TaxID=1822 RepID=UPI0008350BA5|nr:hypothetical protein [Nocardia vaccinii]